MCTSLILVCMLDQARGDVNTCTNVLYLLALKQFNQRSLRWRELKRKRQKEEQKKQKRHRFANIHIFHLGLTRLQETKEVTQEDILAEKLRLQELQRESDLQVAKELFGMTGCDKNCVRKLLQVSLLLKGDSEMTLTTKEDFQAFGEKISKTLKRHEVSVYS